MLLFSLRTGYQTRCIADSGVAIGPQAEVNTGGLADDRRRSDEDSSTDSKADRGAVGPTPYHNLAVGSQAKVK